MNTKKTTTTELFIKNLQSYRLGMTSIPVTEFPGGSQIGLKWESNGTFFKVYNKNNATPIYEGTAKSMTINRILFTNSTLVVMAMLNDQVMYASITLTISYPRLTPESVETANDETINGNLTINGSSTLNSTSVNGTLDVNGNSKFNNVSAPSIKVDGKFSTYGIVSTFNNSKSPIAKGEYIRQSRLEPESDGILVMTIEPPENVKDTSIAVGGIYYAGRWFEAGSNFSTIIADHHPLGVWTPNTLSLPIAANTKCWIRGSNFTESHSTIYFYWFPLGNPYLIPTPIEDLKTQLGEIRHPKIDPQVMMAKRKNKAIEIVSLLEQATDKIFDVEVKEELATRLLKL
ncbi:hypothetical protein ACDQ55_19780 [Chitinophaga sp. 30R24]|uniref:hypothetical protein n=1 Tax=Chitinophaga sp. 30R24 TaxID=3248838 RepID=UPI003B8FF0D0